MRIQSDTIISLTDADFRELVADALDRDVLYCSHNGVRVDAIEEEVVDNQGRWAITFGLEEGK